MAIKIGKLFGTDKLVGTDDDDLLIALGAKTTLIGGLGNDILLGGLNNDILIGGKGADFLSGGLGTDTVDYSGSDAGVTVNLTTGKGSGGDAEGDIIVLVENVIGSAFDDVLTGDKGNNVLTGGDGDDIFVVTKGKDVITDFTPVTTTLITFNELTGAITPIPDGYGGLIWGSTVQAGDHTPAGSGFDIVGLGSQVAFDATGLGGTVVTAGEDFTLISAYMGAAYNDGLEVTIEGWDDGELKVTQTLTLDVERTLVTFVGFHSIDQFKFDAVGGQGTHVVWDDITLAFGDTAGDRIDMADGADIVALVASAVSNGNGGAILTHAQGKLELLGVDPGSITTDWFV